MILEDLGKAKSWREAFAKAQELYDQDEIMSLATISSEEFYSDRYMAVFLEDPDFAEIEIAAALLYAGDNFRLFKKDLNYGPGKVPSLLIVYLADGESITHMPTVCDRCRS